MGNMTRCLAILVVAMFLCSGCVLIAGPQNCENGVQGFSCAPADASSSDGGDTSGYDGGGDNGSSDTVGNDTIGAETTTACKLAGIVDGVWTHDGVNPLQVKSERGSADDLCYVVFVDWDAALEKDVKMVDKDHMNACTIGHGCADFSRVK